MTTKNILVLGGGGFIGSHVIGNLVKNCEANIYSIGRGKCMDNTLHVSHCIDNITFASLEKNFSNIQFDEIINCSGGGNVSVSFSYPREDFQNTVVSLVDVLEFIRVYQKNAKLVQLSSAAVYGECVDLPISESKECDPISVYGEYNFLAERLVKTYSKHYGLQSVILRVFSVYGPGLKKQIIWDAMEKLSRASDEVTFFGTGNELRDFIYIEDLCSIITLAASWASEQTNIINCSSGKPILIKELVNKIALICDRDVSIVFSGESKSGDPKGFHADVSKLSFECKTSLDEGLKTYIDWYQNELKN
ncbi:NAD-dependent epimerase/dehydratase family protein [Vibrio vulnificus]|nr:NAD-dependent epimerase/dehydratase family protein [Vibrio vulnificus]